MVRKTRETSPAATTAAAAAPAESAGKAKAPVRRTPKRDAGAPPPQAPKSTATPRPNFRDAQRENAAADAATAQPESQPTPQRPTAAHAADRDRSVLDTAAMATGQAFRVARDAVSGTVDAAQNLAGNETVRTVASFAGDHKGTVALVAGAVLAPTAATLLSIVGGGAALVRGVHHMSEGKSLGEAASAVGDDVKSVVSTARESWGALKGLFGNKKQD